MSTISFPKDSSGHVWTPDFKTNTVQCNDCGYIEDRNVAAAGGAPKCIWVGAPFLPPAPVTPTLPLPFATSETFFNDPIPFTPANVCCFVCEKELVEALDKYWGKDPVEALKCSDCRYKGRKP